MTQNMKNGFDISSLNKQIEESFSKIEQKLQNLGDEAIEERVKLMHMRERMSLMISSIRNEPRYSTNIY